MPGLRSRLTRRRRTPLTWSVVTASPKGPDGERWGDTWFARDLVAALRRHGERARVVHRGAANAPAREEDDVVLVLRGLRRVVPRRAASGRTTWLLWVISHPELVADDEPGDFDATFAASARWSRAGSFGVPVTALLQATDARRFTPAAAAADSGARVLFVGSTRGEDRAIVRDARAAGAPLTLYGTGWERFVDATQIAGEYLPNADLPAAYAAARIVLNDHWPDMAAEGFLSNRLFDAAATATRVLSDPAAGLSDVFGDVVRTYREPGELADVLQADPDTRFASPERRLDLAERIRRDHSFDARAANLVEHVDRLRAAR